VESVLFKGVHYEMIISVGELEFKIHSTVMQESGSRVGLEIIPFNIHIMQQTLPASEDEEAGTDLEGADV
jgi:spermidine/putrescine transport system ATP-binding protein